MDTKPTIKNFAIIILPALIAIFVIFFLVMPKVRENREQSKIGQITNFEECVEMGYPIMESYPRQCSTPDGHTYTEELSDEIFDEPILGGDADEYGCIGSAGYSWCEPKSKCLRIWEETCYTSIEQEVQYILAKKYSQPVEEVKVTISKQTGDFASGSVLFGQGGPGEGGMFLAVKIDNIWQVVFDGNGSVDCEKMRQEYKFPDEILIPNFCD